MSCNTLFKFCNTLFKFLRVPVTKW